MTLNDHAKPVTVGDRTAYEWLYKNYRKKVFDYVTLMVRNETHAEDIVHEVFLRLWYKREKLGDVENFESYLFIIQKLYTPRIDA